MDQFWRYLSGVFELIGRAYRLDPAALTWVKESPFAIWVAVGVALLAALSVMIGHAVVLLVNRISGWWFAAGCVSAEQVGVAKPHPRVFAVACERLGVPPAEVLHAGDHLEHDVAAALDAGLQAVWVHRDLEGDVPAGAARAADLEALADLVELLT